MTWKEFKQRVEAAGARDEDMIGYIDISAGVMEMSPNEEPFHVGFAFYADGTREIEVC